MNAYEMGHRRVPVSTLPVPPISAEELIGTSAAAAAAKKRGPAPKLQQQMDRIANAAQGQTKVRYRDTRRHPATAKLTAVNAGTHKNPGAMSGAG